MIKLNCIGHLGNDCVINDVNGKRVINFNVAHSEKYKDQQGNEINKTIWVSCAYWNERSGIAQYLKKGTAVYIEGIPDIKMYTNNAGEKKANITCRVNQIQLLGSSNRDGQSNHPPNNQPAQGHGYTPLSEETSDDLPF